MVSVYVLCAYVQLCMCMYHCVTCHLYVDIWYLEPNAKVSLPQKQVRQLAPNATLRVVSVSGGWFLCVVLPQYMIYF